MVSPKLDLKNTDTFTKQNVPAMFGTGMVAFSGLPHCDAMWDLRLDENIQGIFQNIYETKELVCSFTAFSIFVSSLQKANSWLHVDSHPNNLEYCIQGGYNHLPVKETSAGFVVIPGSHKMVLPASRPGSKTIDSKQLLSIVEFKNNTCKYRNKYKGYP